MTTQSDRQQPANEPAPELPEVLVLSYEEGWKLLDERAHRYLGISAGEFIRRWDAGEYRGNADRREVLRVAAALPFARAKTSGRR